MLAMVVEPRQQASSYKMSRVRSKGTTIEKLFGKALWSAGLRYRKHYRKLVGAPDFVLVRYKIAIFCDSAFWHGYKNMKTKRHAFKSNVKFWTNKIMRNIERDKEVNKKLRKEGWKVLRFWDFQIEKNLDKCIERVLNEVRNQ
jgi:DNA mismatch endonuclease (patch repair protein)